MDEVNTKGFNPTSDNVRVVLPPLIHTQPPNVTIIPIKPIKMMKVVVIDRIDITDIKIIPFKNAIVNVSCYTNLREFVETNSFMMSDEEYAQWGNDDAYLHDWVCNKFNAEVDKSVDLFAPAYIETSKHEKQTYTPSNFYSSTYIFSKEGDQFENDADVTVGDLFKTAPTIVEVANNFEWKTMITNESTINKIAPASNPGCESC